MPGYGYGYAQPMMEHHGGGMESLVWIVVAIIVIAVALRHLRHMKRGASGSMSWRCDSALHVLEERYAKGEIDTQEFQERRKVLRA